MEGLSYEDVVRRKDAAFKEFQLWERAEQTMCETIERVTKKPAGEWECPLCHNLFSIVDGARNCTRSQSCRCPDMPPELRRMRDLNLLKRAEAGYGIEHPHELMQAVARIILAQAL